MITRHYYCTACHHDFEARQLNTDDPIRHCPCCEHEQVDETTDMEEEG